METPKVRKLAIVIPALNEEQSIGSTVTACLDARQGIIDNSCVEEIEITVVSDGSTDRTAEIAQGFGDEINLIVFPQNQGYGAAIMEGWRRSDAQLLGFLDADGTCDPRFFSDLCQQLESAPADVVLGCRLNQESRMPPLRRFGNTLFALLLTLFSSKKVRDTASGMRVIRRTALPQLLPLPTGLHFTPAMSARALLTPELNLVEIDMPYHEREGRSKLHPLKDGIRFLSVILKTAFLHVPGRIFALVAALVALMALGWMLYPTRFYLQFGRLEEWMIYRFIVSQFLGGLAFLLLFVGQLAEQAVGIYLWKDVDGLVGRYLKSRYFWLGPSLLVLLAFTFVSEAAQDFLLTGSVYEHWSRFILMSWLLWVASILAVTRVAGQCLNLLALRVGFLRSHFQGEGLGSDPLETWSADP